MLEIEPARYFVLVIKREKLACHKCPEGGVVTAAAGGPKIVEKGKLSERGSKCRYILNPTLSGRWI